MSAKLNHIIAFGDRNAINNLTISKETLIRLRNILELLRLCGF